MNVHSVKKKKISINSNSNYPRYINRFIATVNANFMLSII